MDKSRTVNFFFTKYIYKRCGCKKYIYIYIYNLSNNESQKAIEQMVFDQSELLFKKYKGYTVGGINTELVSSKLKQYILSKEKDLISTIKAFKEYYTNSNNTDYIKKSHSLIASIIKELDIPFLFNLSLSYFLRISCNQDSENNDKFYSINVAIDIGKNMKKRYLYCLKCKDNNYKDGSYSTWQEENINRDKVLISTIENEKIIADLGYAIIQILEQCNMIKNVLITKSKEEKYYILAADNKLLSSGSKFILDLPLKLPMIVKPKPYNNNVLGGYLLNYINYREQLIIPKNIIKDKSFVKEDNLIYNMINNISCIPYKINKELLDFILTSKHDLLIYPNEPSKYENIENKTKYQQGKHKSHISKLNLQETIIGLAEFYKNFPAIYFPVRMDQRGRVYCSNTYLNYQSSELAKALLLFSVPGEIDKNDTNSIKFLEYYGVNCFC